MQGAVEKKMAEATSINSDEFANFSFTPPRPRGRLRSFSRSHRSKYYAMTPNISASKKFGSNTSLTSYGSTQDLTLDSSKQMDLSEDAKSRKISAEIMKHKLYESVITSPRRRRFSHRSDYWSGDGGFYGMARMAQSLPVTPAMTPAVTPGHSQNTSPTHSPRGSRQFMFGLFSRGHQDDDDTMQIEIEESVGARGLATILKPHPKYIAAHQTRWNRGDKNSTEPDEEPMQTDGVDVRMNMSFPPPEHPQFINRLAVGDRDSWFHRTGKTPLLPASTSQQQGYAVAKEDPSLQPPTF